VTGWEAICWLQRLSMGLIFVASLAVVWLGVAPAH
jgi:hypothetical protein